MAGLSGQKFMRDEIENIQANLIRDEAERLKAAVDAKIKASDRAKCLKPVKTTRGKSRARTPRLGDDMIPKFTIETLSLKDKTAYFLFEFASGYALFCGHQVHKLDVFDFESHEKYIRRDGSFTLKAFHPFSSISDALFELDSISNSMVTPQLKSFLMCNLPKRINGKSSYYLATADPFLAHNIIVSTKTVDVASGIWCWSLMRGLRLNIHKFISGLELKDLEQQQLNLARLYIKQRCPTMVGKSSKLISSSSLQQLVVGPHRGGQQQRVVGPHRGGQRDSTVVGPHRGGQQQLVVGPHRGGQRDSTMVTESSNCKQFVVVPHRFEGVFLAKGKEEDFICTRNLVPGEAFYGDELIYVQTDGGTQVQYRVLNPLKSKLAAAIMCGIKNIWVKPGSRVLYLGNVCQVTVAHLSDLVGMVGLVYVVGLSSDIVNMANKWSNVIPILEKPSLFTKHRMIVGMVDVILSDIVYPREVDYIVDHARLYLKAGGHYMISTRVTNIDSTSQDKDLFADHFEHREFKSIEVVMLEPIVREHAMVVGGFRVPEE